jgi:exodeoxyribonuclease V alpha subunit
VSVLTGGPGTGKTSILRALNDILRAKKAVLCMAAPTGRAAQRLAETTGGTARTIHRLLRFDPAEGAFTVNAERPLKADFVIVDESSMLDTNLAADLLRAIPSRAHLLLVGDTDQLPSVGAGNVLKDVIQSGIASVTRLRTIYRQKEQSGIVETAHAVNAGRTQPPAIAASADAIDPDADLQFIEALTPESGLDTLLRLCTEILPRVLRIDPIRDVQILSPMHKGIAGVANLNATLQQALNPSGPVLTHGGVSYRPGDKLIQLRNNYEKNLFNGDLGTVTSVDPEEGALVADFEGESHVFERSDLNDLNLAYAITIHKSQGSEYPVIIMLLLKQHFMMLRRNLVYTGITRGRKKAFLIGDPAAYAMAVRNNETAERHTFLQQRIRGSDS